MFVQIILLFFAITFAVTLCQKGKKKNPPAAKIVIQNPQKAVTVTVDDQKKAAKNKAIFTGTKKPQKVKEATKPSLHAKKTEPEKSPPPDMKAHDPASKLHQQAPLSKDIAKPHKVGVHKPAEKHQKSNEVCMQKDVEAMESSSVDDGDSTKKGVQSLPRRISVPDSIDLPLPVAEHKSKKNDEPTVLENADKPLENVLSPPK